VTGKTIDPAIAHRVDARRRRERRVKRDAEIVLLCNPRAGGRWRELANILDSEEAMHARRIVTDSVEDVVPALADLETDTKLVCIYGGDGTIQRVLDRLTATELESVTLALLGGGTMNVTSRWLGMSRKPVLNFQHVVRAYRSGELWRRELPVLDVDTGGEHHRGFTFGMGALVRLLEAYESGRKGKLAAIGVGVRAMSAAWLPWPGSFKHLLEPMKASVTIDGQRLPHNEFIAVFANMTGQINPGVEPFKNRSRVGNSFHCAAYSVSAREFVAIMPMLMRGWLPIDLRELIGSGIDGDGGTLASRIPTDPRYANRLANELYIDTDERLYTVDGEVLEADGPISVRPGPRVRLAIGPQLAQKIQLRAERAIKR
jgi:diacylglycerol kinase family enzyme